MLKRTLVVVATLYIVAMGVRVYVRKYYVFLPGYVEWTLRHAASGLARARAEAPTHIFFMFVDHFEPDYDASRVDRWAARYRRLAANHHDIDGRSPQHTWY